MELRFVKWQVGRKLFHKKCSMKMVSNEIRSKCTPANSSEISVKCTNFDESRFYESCVKFYEFSKKLGPSI